MRAAIMRRSIALALSLSSVFGAAFSQTPSTPQKPPQEIAPEDVIRITTQLVQTDVVVTDKNDKIVKDLKLEDFELFDNGKKQDLKFLEFVGFEGAEKERRSEGAPIGAHLCRGNRKCRGLGKGPEAGRRVCRR